MIGRYDEISEPNKRSCPMVVCCFLRPNNIWSDAADDDDDDDDDVDDDVDGKKKQVRGWRDGFLLGLPHCLI